MWIGVYTDCLSDHLPPRFFKIFFFLMWTTFKVFTEFLTSLLLFYVPVFGPWKKKGTWDP